MEKKKKDCCGCSACVNACPNHCITMVCDEEGFAYPAINPDGCTGCRLCERVCPANKSQSDIKEAMPRHVQTFAALNPDDKERLGSSSGGVFALLARRVIDGGGVVCGAVFDSDWNVRHAVAETNEQLTPMRGSKYVQSNAGDVFSRVENELKAGRKVLFSGTPCQVMGLNGFLSRGTSSSAHITNGRDSLMENLLTVDVVCHGVPSPLAWRRYLSETMDYLNGLTHKDKVSAPINLRSIRRISFRDKAFGAKDYGFCLDYQVAAKRELAIPEGLKSCSLLCPYYENPYMQSFLKDLCLRPSCYDCKAKGGASGSDITIGDFWGIEYIDPALNDDKGVSLVMVNTPKGRQALESTSARLAPESYEAALAYNPSYLSSAYKPPYRDLFMKKLRKGGFLCAHRAVFSQSLTAKLRRRLWLKLY